MHVIDKYFFNVNGVTDFEFGALFIFVYFFFLTDSAEALW